MEDRQLYRRILGVEDPWRVASVDLQVAAKEVHVYLAHEDLPTWPCAECGAASKLYDHQPERQWRHLTLASTAPSCTQTLRAANALSTACAW
jgi:transposase